MGDLFCEVDLSKVPFEGVIADRVVLSKIYAHTQTLTTSSLQDFDLSEEISKDLESDLRDYTQKVLKRHRRLFRKSDFCPCSSGEMIAQCCGRDVTFL